MSAELGFVVFLFLTVLLLGAVALTGYLALRRVHLALVASAIASLVVTIYYAKQLADVYDLDSAGWITPVHLTLAKIATAAYLGPLITGVMTIRDAARLPLHRATAFVVLGLTLISAGTGAWMIFAAERIG
jgi:hypothetical protein